ncbi:MAG TPA: Hpt domain-containing protein, partial [Paraburkholderia sp.]|nr:Hpt domain-containing protein [Paraburkholderia sp.]
MTLDITQFYQTFFDEADELLAQMEQLLLNLNIGQPDPEDLAAIFRAAHSIKGGAATFGFTALTETTHILESLLDRARNNELVLRKDMIDTFLETKDVLSDQLAAYRASAEPDASAAAAVRAKLERLYAESRGLAAPAAEPAPAAAAVVAEPASTSASTSTVDSEEDLEAAFEANLPAAMAARADAAAPGVPEHVVDEAIDAAPAGAAAGGGVEGPHLRITLRRVDAKDQELLAEELGNLGRVLGQMKTGEDITLWLETDVPADDIVAVCCFVIDESQIVIGRGAAPQGEASAASAAQPSAVAAPAAAPEPVLEPVMQAAPVVQSAPAVAPAPAPQAHAEASAPVAAPAASAASAASTAADHDRKPRAAAAASAEGSSIRVGVEKVDQLINLVGELVITQAMLAETTSSFDPALHDRLFNGMAQLERNARDLQEAVMSIRMMPMDYVFSRFPRLVRDLAA